MKEQQARGALSGIKVMDFTRAMAGPFGTMLLGDLGADVMKIEPPGGDETRKWAPPYMNGVSSYFLSANRNKKSLCLDLKGEGAGEIVSAIAREADVVVENFRPGTAEKLGIGYEELRSVNPGLIYCSISGFGQSGPGKLKPGFDLTVLASSGLMSVTGEEGRPPVKFGVPVTDITAGMFAVISILGALYHRQLTGEGQYIDMSMLDASMLTLTHQATGFFATGINPGPMGSAHASIAPYQVYATSDGYISVAAGSERIWKMLCNALGLEGLMDDPLLSDNARRVENRKYLNSRLEPKFASLSTDDALSILQEGGVPVSRVNRISDLENDPQVKHRNMISEFTHPVYGSGKQLGTPFKMDRTPGSLRMPPPLLGEHTEEILDSVGYSKEAISSLIGKGTVTSLGGKDTGK